MTEWRQSNWPEDLASQQMHVEMIDHLSGVRAGIREETKAGVGNAELPREFTADTKELTHHHIVFGPQLARGSDVYLRYQQDMHAVLRVDIVEGEEVLILVDDGSGEILPGDFTKKTVPHVCKS